ncbi:transposase [Aneurinibacillus thermoaerophilus]|uniref:transposase n=1 Tax=Aneurinibacillus TaxID=55079 RepID=UPI00138ECACE|nr:MULTISPECIES: transposase [Aneurinibacillus]MED0675333.1 transposase [Aneurinibacillus thermoaerophilus]
MFHLCLYKGYKLHLATTPTGIILAQELTTANVYDSDAVSDLLSQLTARLRRCSALFVR